jgi:hypothetical protein
LSAAAGGGTGAGPFGFVAVAPLLVDAALSAFVEDPARGGSARQGSDVESARAALSIIIELLRNVCRTTTCPTRDVADRIGASFTKRDSRCAPFDMSKPMLGEEQRWQRWLSNMIDEIVIDKRNWNASCHRRMRARRTSIHFLGKTTPIEPVFFGASRGFLLMTCCWRGKQLDTRAHWTSADRRDP